MAIAPPALQQQPPLRLAATPIPPEAVSFAPATEYLAGSDPGFVTFGDLNGDGRQDLVAGNAGGVSVLLGRGDGTVQPAVQYTVTGGGGQIVVVDVNKDGKPDVLVADGGSGFSVLLGNGDGTLRTPLTSPAFGGVDGLAIGDVNGDGKLDVVTGDNVTNGYYSVYLGNGDGTFGAPTNVGPVITYRTIIGVALADFNGDGKLDLAAADGQDTQADAVGFQVMFGNGDGTFGTPTWYRTGNTYQTDGQVLVTDFNGDGHPDIAAVDFGSAGGGVVVFLNNGAGAFNASAGLGGVITGWSTVADVNGDGKQDLVTIDSDSPYDANSFVYVFLGNGDGSFQSQVSTSNSPGYGGQSVSAADLNGDGKPDVAVSNGGFNVSGYSNDVSVMLNTSPVVPDGGPITAHETDGTAFCEACVNRGHRLYVKPVSSLTGDFYHTFVDITVPGRGIPLAFAHTYNSDQASGNGPLGYGWTFSYNMSLSISQTTGVVTLIEETGSQVTFTPSGGGYTAPPRAFGSLVKNTDGSFTLHRGPREVDTFNATGQLTGMTDLNGYTTSLAYNGSGQLATVTDPASRSLTLAWTGTHVSSVSDPTGRRVQFQYNDGVGNLTDAIDVNGGLTHFTYDPNHLLLTMTDPRGGVTTNHYDASNRVDYQLDALNRETTFQYTTSGTTSEATTITDPSGNATVDYYIYGELIQETRGYGTSSAATTSYTYDPVTVGQTAMTDPDGHTWHMSYDSRGNLLTQTDPLNRTATNTYDSLDDLLTSQDPLLVTTTNTYDAAGNPLSTSTPLVGSSPLQSSTVTYTYGDPSHPGDVTAITDPDSKTSHRSYDADGDLASVTDALGDTTTFTYNGIGWLQTMVSPRGNAAGANPAQFTTAYSYADPSTGAVDQFGDVRVVTDPLDGRTVTGYDADRNVVSVKDADGNTTQYTYDLANEQTDVVRPDSTRLHTDYYPNGTVHDTLDGANNKTSYVDDPLNRVTSSTDPLNRTTSYTYDAAGNRLTMVDAQSPAQTTTYAYDAANEVTGITYSDGRTPNVSGIQYDADGQRTQMTDGTGTSHWIYDSLHRLTSHTDGSGAVVGYGYDLKGQLASITYPGSHIVQRGYDDAGRLTSVSDWLGHTTTFTPDPDSNVTAEVYPNGTTATTTLDNADRVTAISHAPTSNPSAPFAHFAYGRDPLGQVSSVTSTGVPTDSHTYTYTPLNQLHNVDSGAYAYSPADTVTQHPDASTFAYDAADQLTASQTGITLLGTASGGDAGTTKSVTLALPAGIAVNDQIFVATTQQNGKGVTAPTGYTLVSNVASGGSPAAQTLLYRKQAAGGETSVTVAYQNKFPKSVLVAVYRGLDPGTPIDAQSSATAAATTSVSAPSLTTTLAGDRLAFFAGAVGNATAASWAAPTGMASQVQKSDAASSSAGLFDQTLGGPGATGVRTAALATSAQLVGIMYALKPDATSYTYDPRGDRLSSSTAGGGTTTYSYDQANRLVAYGSSATYAYNGDGLRTSKTVNGTAESFTWDASGSLPHLLVDTTSTSTADYIYGPGGAPLEEVTSAGAVYFFHHDQLGSTRVLTDTTGTPVATFTYDPYGTLTGSTGSISTPLLYAGQYRDAESDLYYLRARYYDPPTAEFLSRDPLVAATGVAYGYGYGDPLNNLDPAGLDSWGTELTDSSRLKFTQHAIDQFKARDIPQEWADRVVDNAQATYEAEGNGTSVSVWEYEPGRYGVVVRNATGKVVNGFRGVRLGSLCRMARSFKYKDFAREFWNKLTQSATDTPDVGMDEDPVAADEVGGGASGIGPGGFGEDAPGPGGGGGGKLLEMDD